MPVETKKTDVNKYSYRDASFFNFWRRTFLFIVTHIFYMMIFKIIYRIEIYGKENIPKDNNFIIAANHLSNYDPPLVCSIMNRGVAYMAKKELFNNLLMRWWLDWLGAFAVDREKLGVSTIKTVKKIKETGWVLGIFPQGTRQADGEISHVTKGFVSLAKSTKCGILPIGIIGTNENKKIPFTGKIIVRIGELIPYNDDTEEIVDKWGNSIEKLTGFKYIAETV